LTREESDLIMKRIRDVDPDKFISTTSGKRIEKQENFFHLKSVFEKVLYILDKYHPCFFYLKYHR
jgi:hypothetical protein